jgi:hypothetical protein
MNGFSITTDLQKLKFEYGKNIATSFKEVDVSAFDNVILSSSTKFKTLPDKLFRDVGMEAILAGILSNNLKTIVHRMESNSLLSYLLYIEDGMYKYEFINPYKK